MPIIRYAGAIREEDPWTVITYYRSSDLVTQAYKRLNQREPNRALANSIASHVAQAAGYFKAARHGEELVEPTLLYYGNLGLSRALVLLARTKSSEAALSQAHGVELRSWESAISSQNLLELQLKPSRSGTFFELMEAVQDSHTAWLYTREFPARIQATFHLRMPPEGTIFSIDDLLSRTPGLEAAYSRVTSRPPRVQEGVAYWSPSNTLVLYAPSSKLGETEEDQARISSKFWQDIGILDFRSPHQGVDDPYLAEGPFSRTEIWKNFGEAIQALGYAENDSENTMFFIQPFPHRVWLAPLPRMFLISYTLGMLARYYPSVWSQLLLPGSGDRAYPLLREALSLIHREFPRMWVQAVEGM